MDRKFLDAANAIHARLEGMDGDNKKPTWELLDDYEKARASLDAEKAGEPTPSVEGPTLEECVRVAEDVLGDPEYLDDRRDAYAAVRSLCLPRRAPSIEDVLSAVQRVRAHIDDAHNYTGLVYRADVEQVMRSLFDRRKQ